MRSASRSVQAEPANAGAVAMESERGRGAESSGNIKGGGSWKVFAIDDAGRLRHVLVVNVRPGHRAKRRLPVGPSTATRELRARFAKGMAPEVMREELAAMEAAERARAAKAEQASRRPTFADVARMWTSGDLARLHPDHVSIKASVEDDRSRLKVLCDEIGDVPIDDPNWIDHAQRAMTKLPERCRTPGTRRQYAGLVRRVLQLGVWPLRLRPDQPLPRNFQPKAGKAKATQWIRPKEEARLASSPAVPFERRILWGVLAREGMRDGEAVLLAWRDLDLDAGVLTLDKNKTKNPRAWKLDDGTRRALIAWRTRRYADGDPPPDALVFVDVNGRRSRERGSPIAFGRI